MPIPRAIGSWTETASRPIKIIETRRRSDLITPVPKPKKRRRGKEQAELLFDDGDGLSTAEQEYNPTPIINEIRGYVETGATCPIPDHWQVTPETARLLQHWRHHPFAGHPPLLLPDRSGRNRDLAHRGRPEARRTRRRSSSTHLEGANEQANPELFRIALKLATGAGKTTVMAMLIAWQTVNAVRHPHSKHFSRGFLIVTPGITIRDRLRVLLPNDPENYYRHRELVPPDLLGEIDRAKIVITNYHAFKLRERIELSQGRARAAEGPRARAADDWKPKARCSSASCPS